MPFYAPYPPPDRSNPFQIPLAEKLRQHHWEIKSFNWRPVNLFKYRNKVLILHFHWPESQWRSQSVLLSVLKAIWWIIRAELSILLGYRLVWSAHNVLPHYSSSMTLEHGMRRYILRRFDLIVGHALNCQNDLVAAFGTCGRRYVVAPLGVYAGLYPVRLSREEARKKFSLDENETVVLLFGSQSAYKGTDVFLRSWKSAMPLPLSLMVVGDLSDYAQDVVNTLEYCQYLPGRVVDEDIADLVQMSDFLAIPYQHITTSSMYFLALTFHMPVIAPNLPFFVQHSYPTTAVLYNHNDPEQGLREALARIAAGWKPDPEQIAALVKRFDWNTTSDTLAQMYNEITLT